jgi:uncharacterized damage-inducible protein DinB
MASSRDDIIDLSDHVWGRLLRRLKGIDDEEYFWEPVLEVRTVRLGDDGLHHSDGHVRDSTDPHRFTTLAWRLCHIVDLLDAGRIATWLGVPDVPTPVRSSDPGSAEAALAMLSGAYGHWSDVLSQTTEESLAEPIGIPEAGRFAESTRRSFALHIIDELIHHGAEAALLRDLYAATEHQLPAPAST